MDASLVAAWLLPEELSDKAIRLRETLRSAGEDFVAPALLVAEVSSTLRKAVHRKRIPQGVGDEAIATFKAFPIEIFDAEPLLDSAWAWARVVNAPRLYDVFYLALADRQDCDLWTADQRFVRLIGKSSPRVRWVGDVVLDA